jgi:predicted lipid-binding transport protein (Tim44 family)
MGRLRPGRVLLTIFVLGFCLFFGIDLVSRSNAVPAAELPAAAAVKPAATAPAKAATVSGRQAVPAAAKASPATSPAAKNGAVPAGAKTTEAANDAQAAPRVQVKESFMNHLSNRLGDALHNLAKGLMSFIVSIFNSLIS